MLTLSKSKFMAGLGCPKLLWCMYNAPKMIPPVDEATQAIFDQGHEVGDLAKKRHPDGVEVDWEKGFEYTLTRTKELLKLRKPIFEASFKHKNGYCRADLLIPVGKKEWDLIEVKSSAKVKDEHFSDVAFQKYCIEGNGVEIRRCHLMFVNNEYVRKGKIDSDKFFESEDLTEEVDKMVPDVEEQVNELLRIIRNPKMPEPQLGVECVDPSKCPVCMNDLPKNSVAELYWMGKKAYPLLNDGVVLIKDLPESFKLNDKQQVQKAVVLSGKPHIEPKAIKQFLKGLKYPLYFLDFETVGPAIPLFDGTRPFQQIPFQLSLHIIKKQGAKPEHVEFLADSPDDPRSDIVKTLKSIGKTGTVLAYNMSFEKGVIEDLLEAFPKEKWLHSIIDRLDDLILPFRNFWYYHPEQHGSCSIKSVLPALTGRSYAHLEVSKGDEAARKFLAMTYKGEKMDKESVRKSLLEYCKQDTEGMVQILKKLEQFVSI